MAGAPDNITHTTAAPPTPPPPPNPHPPPRRQRQGPSIRFRHDPTAHSPAKPPRACRTSAHSAPPQPNSMTALIRSAFDRVRQHTPRLSRITRFSPHTIIGARSAPHTVTSIPQLVRGECNGRWRTQLATPQYPQLFPPSLRPHFPAPFRTSSLQPPVPPLPAPVSCDNGDRLDHRLMIRPAAANSSVINPRCQSNRLYRSPPFTRAQQCF